jgi:hypothetical protein
MLAKKIKKLPATYLKDGDRGSADTARTSFLMNLCEQLKIAVKIDQDRGLLPSLIDAVGGYGKEIPKKKIQKAHESMQFPWSRSIISACLYPSHSVTGRGVPMNYSKTN